MKHTTYELNYSSTSLFWFKFIYPFVVTREQLFAGTDRWNILCLERVRKQEVIKLIINKNKCLLIIILLFFTSAVVLFVVISNEKNIFDHRLKEFKLWQR